MNEFELGKFLLSLSLIFGLSYTLGYFLSKLKIPNILAALFIGVILSYTPFFPFIKSGINFNHTFEFLSNLGILFLLLL